MRQSLKGAIYTYLQLSNPVFWLLSPISDKKVKKKFKTNRKSKNAIFLIYIDDYVAFA